MLSVLCFRCLHVKQREKNTRTRECRHQFYSSSQPTVPAVVIEAVAALETGVVVVGDREPVPLGLAVVVPPFVAATHNVMLDVLTTQTTSSGRRRYHTYPPQCMS